MSKSAWKMCAVAGVTLAAFLVSPGCGSKRPTDSDTLPPFVQWVSPGISSSILEYPNDTVTVEFSAADDGGVISQVTVYLQGAPVAILAAAPFRTTLNLSALGHNRPGSVFATASDPTGKVGRTQDTLRFMVRPVDTVTWRMLTPALQPSARVGHSMSLDAAGQRAILFGGQSFVTFDLVNDIWAFDFVGDSWVLLDTTGAPPARKDHGAGVLNGTLVVFGGQGQRGDTDIVRQDYALFDLGAQAWATNLFDIFLQPLRSTSTAVVGSRLYAYGGSNDSNVQFAATDSTLHVFDMFDTSWADIPAYTGGPRLRIEAMLTGDREAGRLVLYGGAVGSTVLPTDASHYRFTPGSAVWNSVPQIPQIVPPVARGAAVYDSLNNRLLFWGGIDNAGGLPTDVWEFSLGNLRWRRLATAGAAPPGRTEHEMVIDPNPARDTMRARAIIFGGRVNGIGVAETWEMRW